MVKKKQRKIPQNRPKETPEWSPGEEDLCSKYLLQTFMKKGLPVIPSNTKNMCE